MYLVGVLPLLPWRLRHRLHYLVDSVHYFLLRVRAFQPYYSVSPSPSKPESPVRRSRSGLQQGRVRLLCPRLTSAAVSHTLTSAVAPSAQRRISPGNAHLPSRLCPSHLQPCLPYRYWASKINASSPGMTAFYALPVRRASALPSPSFRFPLAKDTLGVRLTVHAE